MSVDVTGVNLSQNAAIVINGGSVKLFATVYPLNATDQTVVWESSNLNVCVVDNTGLVSSVGVGQCNITVTTNDGGFTNNAVVAVQSVQSGAMYGQMLASFAEQLVNVLYFSQEPNLNNGWQARENVQIIRAIIQNRGSMVKDSNGNLVRSSNDSLWSMVELQQGWFIEWLGKTYRLTSDGRWDRYGGFWHNGIELLVGTQNSDTTEPDWKIGGVVV